MARLELWNGDICDLEVDAIVNAASPSLYMATGVAGAIKRRGGDRIEFEAVRQGPALQGSAVVTGAGDLAARYVIHAVSLASDRRATAGSIDGATRAAMRRVDELGLESVAFPALGTGVGGFPLAEAAALVVGAVRDELPRCRSVERVVFALRGSAAYLAFQEALAAPASVVAARRSGSAA